MTNHTENTKGVKWNQGLIGPALQIAQTNGTPIWVAAGPGTGKTFALKRRVARLLDVENVPPEKILVSTFTRTAAIDLAKEVSGLGIKGADEVKAQTLHSFCFSMLSTHEVLEATGRVPRPLLHCEERFLLEDLSRNGGGGIRECGKQVAAFSAAWARLQHEEPGWPRSEADKKFQRVLHSWLSFHKAMLIGELIPEALKYLRTNPHSPYRTSYDHVLVDEYQDLNRAEQSLIDLVSSRSLVVIGDEDQSIYSFKHAHPEGITEFPGGHPTTEKAQLDECRRCPRRLVEMANSLISHNTLRIPRALRPFPSNPDGEIFAVQWRSMEEEARGIARFLKSRIEAGTVTAGNILVLAPRREFGYLVRDELRGAGVSAHSFFSEQLLEGNPKHDSLCQAQQAMARLILLADRQDRVALRCWCGFGSDSLRAVPWAKVRSHCEESGLSPWETLEQIEAGNLSIPHTAPLIERFKALKKDLGHLAEFDGEGLFDALFPPKSGWAEPFTELKVHLEGKEEFGPRELLALVRQHVTQPELPTDVDYVRIMSLHKSKGLTAQLVVVLGCVEGLTPSVDTSASQPEQLRSLEEQRRLFYVALTRAKATLLLSSVSSLPTDLTHKMRATLRTHRRLNSPTINSRFLSELGPECPASVTGEQFMRIAVNPGNNRP